MIIKANKALVIKEYLIVFSLDLSPRIHLVFGVRRNHWGPILDCASGYLRIGFSLFYGLELGYGYKRP